MPQLSFSLTEPNRDTWLWRRPVTAAMIAVGAHHAAAVADSIEMDLKAKTTRLVSKTALVGNRCVVCSGLAHIDGVRVLDVVTEALARAVALPLDAAVGSLIATIEEWLGTAQGGADLEVLLELGVAEPGAGWALRFRNDPADSFYSFRLAPAGGYAAIINVGLNHPDLDVYDTRRASSYGLRQLAHPDTPGPRHLPGDDQLVGNLTTLLAGALATGQLFRRPDWVPDGLEVVGGPVQHVCI